MLRLTISIALFLGASPLSSAANCDKQWKANVVSTSGTRRWIVQTQIATMNVEAEVSEGSRVVNPTTLETWSETRVTKSLIPIPEQRSTRNLTKTDFCDRISGKKQLELDPRSPCVLIAQMVGDKPLRIEKVTVPAGTFTAGVYEKQVGKKGAPGSVFITAWIAKVGHRHLGVKFVALSADGLAAGTTLGKLAAYRFK